MSIKIVVVYALIVVLVFFAQPKPDLLSFVGLGLIALGQILRFWATGHLVKNKVLTTSGPYAYVKNPLYVGTFLIMVGFCLIARGDYPVNWILLGLGVLVFAAYYVPYKKKREGDRLRKIFGAEWDDYDRAVPDYFPQLRPYGKGERRWSFRAVLENSEPWTLVAIVGGVLAIYYRDLLEKVVRDFLR
ncbi:MAG: hypothetical protein A2Z34_11760 [Planctomycetes bacterium RBG_16_59_8]|nr:MAG: hypothetical protein A2Z34_11760 [Planctomycetes bacterium RBG_16_59_8]